ncbi:MAG: hypothetical protein HY821_17065 [Acidobacteria bacterium]|nr:hypothetical protein [Acidobacteriota bacterium]
MSAKRWLWIIAAAAAALWLLDALTATRPAMPPARSMDFQTRRPDGRPFSRTLIAPTFAGRRRLYLEWAAQRPTPADRGGIFNDLQKLASGAIDHPSQPALQAALDFVNARRDPSDFTVAGLVRLYYLHHAGGRLLPGQSEAVRHALINYKYALDEPGISETEMWTENHQALSLSSEFLAGQIFPEALFSNDQRSGRQHQAKARAGLLRWIDYHARTGMAEWDSVPYYNMDLSALLNLVEFAEDAEVRTKAAMMVDLLLFDVAVDSFYGQLGTSHGRATASTIRSAAGDSLMTVQALLFGRGRLQTVDMAATMLVTGSKYTLPPVLEAVALDTPEEAINFERHSIPLDEAAARQYGLTLAGARDFETWWGMGAFSNPETINLMFDAVRGHNLWNYSYFRGLRSMDRYLRPLGILPTLSRLLDPDSNGTLMSEVNKVSYRTPDAMLSSAQDFRAGQKGYQQHIWQATLGPYAVVFATNPDALDLESRPSYWASNGRLPRTAQHRNVLISIFNISRHPSPFGLEKSHYGFTHAWFPKWAFDEVRESGGWVFGRAGDGYVGLYSARPYQWVNTGPDAGAEIAAPGLENVWICQVGRRAQDGSFDEFVRRLGATKVTVDGLDVQYGEFAFGWTKPFTVNGKAIELHGYPRWRNPYAHTRFGTRRFHIAHAGRTLELDFVAGTRTAK